MEKSVYVVLTKTTTILGRIIRFCTGFEYNHVSISLNKDLSAMYSFGRRSFYNPLNSGFVHENYPDKKPYDYFLAHRHTPCMVYEFKISQEQYDEVKRCIEDFSANSDDYAFNIIGLVFNAFGKKFIRKNKFFCAQFVSHVIRESNIYLFDKDDCLLKPSDFLDIEDSTLVYCGEISMCK